jgi:hypothetical protein
MEAFNLSGQYVSSCISGRNLVCRMNRLNKNIGTFTIVAIISAPEPQVGVVILLAATKNEEFISTKPSSQAANN